MFSQIMDQKEHKNKCYKFGSPTSRYKPHPTVQWALVRALWYELKWTIFALVSFTASEAMRPFN